MADFESTLRTRLDFYKERKLNGLLFFKAWVRSSFVKKKRAESGFDSSNFNIGQLSWDLNRHPRGPNRLYSNRNRLASLG
jgi:hypothetical protein